VIPQRVVDGDFAGWLRDAMADRGMTTRVLEMRAGVDHTTISRLRRGANAPTLTTAVALLRVLTPTTLGDGPRNQAPADPGKAANDN
jgi:transcriptional regulator with XRE-family HTH domain